MALEISAAAAARARSAVRPLAERLDLASRLEPYRAQSWDGGELEVPVLHLDDFSGIPFLVDITGVEEYQHRARLRAGVGDLYAAATEPTPGYETYCRRRLHLEPVEFVRAEPSGDPLSLALACGDGPALERLVSRARDRGGLAIHPFMGIEGVWALARRIAEEARVDTTVVAPPPPVTWIANDKLLFGQVVERVLGSEWLVETRVGDSIPTLVEDLLGLAKRHSRVALKRLRCASAMGNAVFDSPRISKLSRAEVEREVDEFLVRTEWQGEESVLAVAWEDTEHSPSTQLWIPPLGKGPPRLDGIYEQLLRGSRRVFVGSRPSTLPAAVNRSLAEASLAVGGALQALGYAGRCSFDLLVVGDPAGDFELRFVECNGRWGGTSTPMAWLDRLIPGPRPPYRARDFEHPDLVDADFTELLRQVGEAAWDARTGRGRFLFYNTGPLRGHGKLDVIALGASQAAADAALEDELPRLWGL